MATTITLLNLEIIVLRTLTLDSNKYEEGREKLESIFPGLANGSYEILAPPMPTDERKEYEEEGKLPPNCFSNALGIQTHAVDPVSGLVDAYSSPYQTLDKWFTEDRNFSPRSEYSSDNLLDYPPGTVLIYEGSLNDQHPLFGLFPNAQIPTHAATLTDNGVWYSVTGPGGVHLLHANAEDFSGGIIGKPKYVYQPLPLQK